MAAAIVCWIICKTLNNWISLSSRSCANQMQKTLMHLKNGALNVLVVQLYGGFGDIMFFSLIEIKSVSLDSTWSRVSLATAFGFLVLGLCLLGLHWNFLLRHRKLRSKSPRESAKAVKLLETRNTAIRSLYEDFNNTSLFKHGFIFVLVARDTAISLLVPLALSFPLAESIFMCFCSMGMFIYLLFNNPFESRYDWFFQMFGELCVLIVYLAVLSFAVSDFNAAITLDHRNSLSLLIEILNIILLCECLCVILWKTVLAALVACKRRRGVQTVVPEPLVHNENSYSSLDRMNGAEQQSKDTYLLHQQSIVANKMNNSPLFSPGTYRGRINAKSRFIASNQPTLREFLRESSAATTSSMLVPQSIVKSQKKQLGAAIDFDNKEQPEHELNFSLENAGQSPQSKFRELGPRKIFVDKIKDRVNRVRRLTAKQIRPKNQ